MVVVVIVFVIDLLSTPSAKSFISKRAVGSRGNLPQSPPKKRTATKPLRTKAIPNRVQKVPKRSAPMKPLVAGSIAAYSRTMKKSIPSVLGMLTFMAFAPLAFAQNAVPPAAVTTYLERAPDSDKGFASEQNFATAQAVATAFAELAAASDTKLAAGFTLADKAENALYVVAEASDMTPGEPVEFFITTTNSGYNYESIAVAYAPPSAIHKGLEFLGAKPGWPVNYNKLRFWPRGDHIAIDVLVAGHAPRRIEQLASDETTTNAIVATDFVFVGSEQVAKPGVPGETVYAADAISPQSIAANFNLLETVLDLPQQRAKSGVYGQHFYGKTNPLRPRQPVVLRFRRLALQPELYLTMDVQGSTMQDLAFTLKDAAGKNHIEGGDKFTDLVASFDTLTAKNLPHIDIAFGPDIQLGALRQIAQIFKQINSPTGIRIGPPVDGQLYFETFAPNEGFRDRMERPSQPFELHLKKDRAELIDITEKWIKGKLEPELEPKTIAVESPDQLPALIKASPNERETIFIYAEPTMSHVDIMAYIEPVQDMFKVFFVYTAEVEK